MKNDFEPSGWAEFIVDIFRNLGYVTDQSSNTFGRSLLNLFTVFAPAVAPLGPAVMFSANFYAGSAPEVGHTFAIWASVAVGLALECAGIIAAKTAVRWLDEYQNNPEAKTKLFLSIFIVFIYFVAGVGTTFLENTPNSMKWLTFVSFTIAVIVYGASALYEDVEKKQQAFAKIETVEIEAEEARRLFELEEARKDRELKRQLATLRQNQRGELAKQKLEFPVMVQATSTAPAPVLVPVAEEVGYARWQNIPDDVRLTFANMSLEQILEENPRIVKRTARNWVVNSKKLQQ